MKIAQKTNYQYDYFKLAPHLNQLFNQLDNDFKKLAEIAKNLNLNDNDVTILCQAQYQNNPQFNNQTDALITKLDQNGKLSQLPDKAFDTLMNYRAAKLNIDKLNMDNNRNMLQRNPNQLSDSDKLQPCICSRFNHLAIA